MSDACQINARNTEYYFYIYIYIYIYINISSEKADFHILTIASDIPFYPDDRQNNINHGC